MPYQPHDDWYQILVDQSKTHWIYTLIHEGLNPDFKPRDKHGFVLVIPLNLPPQLTPIPSKHKAKSHWELDFAGLVLLKNNCLAPYLEKAAKMEVYETAKTQYAVLVFDPEKTGTEDEEKV